MVDFALPPNVAMRFGAYVLNRYGSPQLAELTLCGAPPLDEPPNLMGAFILNDIFAGSYPEPTGRLLLMFGRRILNAVHEYKRGREELLSYVSKLQERNNHFLQALRATTYFEQSIGSTAQAVSFLQRIGKLNSASFPEDDRIERVRRIWNRSKHFDEDIADSKVASSDISAPVWLTNSEISSTVATVTFEEFHSLLSELIEALERLSNRKAADAS